MKVELRRHLSMRQMVRNLMPVLLGKSLCSPAYAAGLTYSGVGALSLLGRIPRKGRPSSDGKMMSPDFVNELTRWLVSRQTLMLQDTEDGLDVAEDEFAHLGSAPAPVTTAFPPTFHVLGGFPVPAEIALHGEPPSIEVSPYDQQWVGVNGRCNKVADTCYSFWVGGTLGVSSRRHPESAGIF
jgi:geranylgeranyl transferase type-1 subunit beta